MNRASRAMASADRWLVLIYSVPASAGAGRVRIWRRLKKIGAVSFRNSVYLLPCSAERYEIAQWLCQEIRRAKGEVTLLTVDRIENLPDAAVADLFRRARDADYAELTAEAKARLTPRVEHPDEPAALADAIEAVEKRLNEIRAIDFFQARGRRRVLKLLRRAKAALRQTVGRETREPPVPDARRLRPADYRGRVWVTRPRPHVDRIASPWLIRRFIDPRARFAFAADPAAVRGAVPFDYVGVEFGHHGDACTFETLLRRFGFRDPALQAVAEIVHDMDLKDAKFGREEALGFDAVLRGLAAVEPDDQALLARGLTVFDALYTHLGGAPRRSRK